MQSFHFHSHNECWRCAHTVTQNVTRKTKMAHTFVQWGHIPHNTQTLSIWTILCTAPSQHQINPAHIISPFFFFPFRKEGRSVLREDFLLLQMRLWLVEDSGEEQKGTENCHREYFGREFEVQPASIQSRSHVASVYRQHSVYQNSPLCFGDIICALRTHYIKCLELWYDVSEHQKNQSFEKLPRGLTSDLPSNCGLVVGDFIENTLQYFLALMAPVRVRPPYPNWITDI